MSILLGVALAVGLLLLAAPWLWPRSARLPRSHPHRTGALLAAAGVDRVTPAGLVAIMIGSSLASAALLFAVTGVPMVGMIAGVAAAGLPIAVLRHRARLRAAVAQRAWPDAIDHIVAAIRSGIALPDAVGALANRGPVVFRDAFQRFSDDYGRTGSFGLAADELKRRLADPVADRIIETLRMAREVGGGELTSVLRDLALHLRSEGAIRAEVEARQSGVANTAKLGVAAPWVVLVLLCTRPEAAAAYASGGGVLLLVAGAMVSFVAYRLMRAIGRLPTEGRWFG